MTQLFIQRRRVSHTRLNLRLLVILLSLFYISSISRSQFADSLIHLRTDVSSEYSDIVRQRTDRSSTTIFARSFDAAISASQGCDTLTLAYSMWNRYASYNNLASAIALSAENGLRSLSLQWISSVGWLDYSATAFFPFSRAVLPLHYSAWIRLKPFGRTFIPSLTYERMPTSFTSGLGLKDFSFSLDEHSIRSAWNITLKSQPMEFMEGSFSWGKNITTTKGEAAGYSSPLDWNTQTFSTQLRIYPEERSSVWIGWKRSEEKGEMHLTKDDLSFGDLSYGRLFLNRWYTGANAIVFSLPISCEYSYFRWKVYDVGHIESWPFTSLASTVFDNRLYYSISGIIHIHQVEGSTAVACGVWNIKPSFGLLYIIPDVSLRRWEPDFLVFCIKNVKEEPSSIQHCWLLRLGCEVNFSVFSLHVALQMEQYIPIYVKDRNKQDSAGGPSTPAVSSTPSSTDGGRRIRLQILIP
jgi:hypothetical protein